MLENLPRSQPQARLPGAGDYLNAENRIAAEMEEVVVPADAHELEQFRPDTNESALRVGARLINLFSVADRKVGRRQRAAINLAVRRYRYRIEEDESRRNHVGRQSRRQKLAQLSQMLQPLLRFGFAYYIRD